MISASRWGNGVDDHGSLLLVTPWFIVASWSRPQHSMSPLEMKLEEDEDTHLRHHSDAPLLYRWIHPFKLVRIHSQWGNKCKPSLLLIGGQLSQWFHCAVVGEEQLLLRLNESTCTWQRLQELREKRWMLGDGCKLSKCTVDSTSHVQSSLIVIQKSWNLGVNVLDDDYLFANSMFINKKIMQNINDEILTKLFFQKKYLRNYFSKKIFPKENKGS